MHREVKEKEVLDICNKIRRIGNGEVLDKLLPGVRHNSRSCLIARNLNFNCNITPIGNKWIMRISDIDLGRKIARNFNWDIYFVTDYSIELVLPDKLGRAAREFDGGHWPMSLYVDRRELFYE